MNRIADFKNEDLHALRLRVQREYEAFRARGLALDLTRGKPAPEQLDLANELLALPGSGDYLTQAGEDARNYGTPQDRAFVFASTSKVTLAGAGLAFLASSLVNVRWRMFATHPKGSPSAS